MKKVLLTLIIGAVLAGASCNKIKDAIFPTIDIELPAFQVTLPPIPIVLNNEASLGSFSMHFNMDSIIRANTAGVFGASAVSTVKVKTLQVNVGNADENNNLANFESVRFALSSDVKEDAAEILSVTFPDTYSVAQAITPANSPELREYLLGTELTYTILGKGRRPTTRPLTFNVIVTVSAK